MRDNKELAGNYMLSLYSMKCENMYISRSLIFDIIHRQSDSYGNMIKCCSENSTFSVKKMLLMKSKMNRLTTSLSNLLVYGYQSIKTWVIQSQTNKNNVNMKETVKIIKILLIRKKKIETSLFIISLLLTMKKY